MVNIRVIEELSLYSVYYNVYIYVDFIVENTSHERLFGFFQCTKYFSFCKGGKSFFYKKSLSYRI